MGHCRKRWGIVGRGGALQEEVGHCRKRWGIAGRGGALQGGGAL